MLWFGRTLTQYLVNIVVKKIDPAPGLLCLVRSNMAGSAAPPAHGMLCHFSVFTDALVSRRISLSFLVELLPHWQTLPPQLQSWSKCESRESEAPISPNHAES